MDPLARDKDVTPWQPVTRQFNKNPNALGQAAQQR
jgi:hypothetical protein